MKIRIFLIIVLFALPMFVQAGNKKTGENTWTGTASYYHNMFEGRKTANGDIFRQNKLTGANNFLPLGIYVRVTNTKNGKTVIVKVNDRMNKRLTHRRLIDLSRGAAKKLGFINAGLAKVKMEVLPNYKKGKKYKKPKKEEILVQNEKDTLNAVDSISTKNIKDSKPVFKFPAWANVILKYKLKFKTEKSYVDGALRGELMQNTFQTKTMNMISGKSYKLILLSRVASSLKTLNIIPSLKDKKVKGERNYAMVNLKPDGVHSIFIFNYEAPLNIDLVSFNWEADTYADASDEDFALFVLEDK